MIVHWIGESDLQLLKDLHDLNHLTNEAYFLMRIDVEDLKTS